jgi:Raf kinase inhibitor-like YbhB/YbcL family protein
VTVTATPLAVTSTSYANGGVIPLPYASTLYAAGGGQNTSPALAISNVPASTQSLAVVMDDETAPCGVGAAACVHWGVFNLPATKVSIIENEDLGAISGVILGLNNTAGTFAYDGPHPPSNHVYNLTVYALSTAAPVSGTVTYTRSQFEATFGSQILEKITYSGKFPL